MSPHQNSHDPRRRMILHGAIATGCALGIPMLLGCKGEESGQAQAPSAPTANPTEPPAQGSQDGASGKLSQTDAKYQGSPNGDQQCGNCLHFIAESNTCRVVDGQVSPNGWCTMWARQA